MRCNQFNAYGPNDCVLDAGAAYLDDKVALRDLAVAAAQTVVSKLLAYGDYRAWRLEGLKQDALTDLNDGFERGCDRAHLAVLANPATASAAAAHTTAATLIDEQAGLQLCFGFSRDMDDERQAERELGEGVMAHDLAVRAALFVALASSSSALLALPYLSL